MKFFPMEHEEVDIFPKDPKVLSQKLEVLSKRRVFTGVFFPNMFTLNLRKNPTLVATGYYSQDSKKMILDYFVAKPYRLLWLFQVFILPFIFLLFYVHFNEHLMPDNTFVFMAICFVFYFLCACIFHLVNVVVFRFSKKEAHSQILLHTIY